MAERRRDATGARPGLLARLFGRGASDADAGAIATDRSAAATDWRALVDGLRALDLRVAAPVHGPVILDAGPPAEAIAAAPLSIAAVVPLQHALMVLLPVRLDEPVTDAPRAGAWQIGTGRHAQTIPNPLPLLDQVLGALRARVGRVPVQGLVVALPDAVPHGVPLPARVSEPSDVRALLRDLAGGGHTSLPTLEEAWAALTGESRAEGNLADGPDPSPAPPPTLGTGRTRDGTEPSLGLDTAAQPAPTIAPEVSPPNAIRPVEPAGNRTRPRNGVIPVDVEARPASAPPPFRRADALALPSELSPAAPP